jgi:nucleotide-binding universal stress UspA family protein
MSKIFVPSDFTPVSNVAIRYGCEIAESTKSEVYLLHIVKTQGEIEAAKKKLEGQAADHATRHAIKINIHVRVGNIFDDIPDVAAEENAELIVMGTHGMQGMQFIVGSNALRIISESKVPMIIVQADTKQSAKISKLLIRSIFTKRQNRNLKSLVMSLRDLVLRCILFHLKKPMSFFTTDLPETSAMLKVIWRKEICVTKL